MKDTGSSAGTKRLQKAAISQILPFRTWHERLEGPRGVTSRENLTLERAYEMIQAAEATAE